MNLDILIPDVEFSTAELHQIADAISTPAVRKYLKNQQAKLIKAIGNGLPKEEESAESYVRRQSVVVGGLAVYESLLTIEPVKATQ